MVTEFPSAGFSLRVFHEGAWHELIIRSRQSGEIHNQTSLGDLTAKTIGIWLRAWQAINRDIWDVGAMDSPEIACGVKSEGEPFVTVFNKDYNGLSITVHSSENGQGAVNAAHALLVAKEKLESKMPELFEASKPATASKEAPKQDINDVDSFLKDASDKQDNPPVEAGDLPFRRFKQLAEGIIQVQEFKQGGDGDKYQRSAVKASLPFHKTTVQYEDDSLIYYPITGAITIVEGQYGTQAVIPSANGRIYVSKENKSGEETPDWHNFAQDLHDNYALLADGTISQFFAPDCILVMKTGKQKGSEQWKNYYHCYQPLKA